MGEQFSALDTMFLDLEQVDDNAGESAARLQSAMRR